MNRGKIVLCFAIAMQLSNVYASAENNSEIIEVNLSKRTQNPANDEWFACIAAKSGEKAFNAYVHYAYNVESRIGTLKKWYTCEEIRKKGYGGRLLKHGIVQLYAYKPSLIEWDAEPLDNYNSRQCLRDLERAYQSFGAIKVSESNLVVSSGFQYPLPLAASLAILNPILSRQQSSACNKTKPTDLWKVVVSYLKPEDVGYEKAENDCYTLIKAK